MVVFLWIWNILSPFIFISGIVFLAFGDIESWILIAGGGTALIGLIIGFTNWAIDVPPRWFWVKSNLDLFEYRIITALSYAIQFFFIPMAIMTIIELV